MTKNCIAFRLDDITPDMNWDNFNRLKEIFYRYNIKPLIGVVPDNRDKKLSVGTSRDDFDSEIKQLIADGWCLAMHGCFHIYDTKDGGMLKLRPLSEFAGHSFEEQLEKLSYGQKLLNDKGLFPEVFMAPGHTFDRNTLEALRKLGIKYITDGLTDEPYKRFGMFFLPSKNSRPKLRKGFDTICLHTNDMNEESFDELEIFLKNHSNQVVAFLDMLRSDYPSWGIKYLMQDRKNRMMARLRKLVAGNKLLHGLLALRK